MSLEKLIETDEAYFVGLANDLTEAQTAFENTLEWNGAGKGGQIEEARQKIAERASEIYELLIARLKKKGLDERPIPPAPKGAGILG